LIKQDVLGALSAERDKAAQALKTLLGKYHYSSFGGAPLLGVDGICIICHGSSDDRAIRNALNVASQHARSGVNEKIIAELKAIPTGAED
jgi:glycerol-3-phosphate acyltransferase PlsX